MLLSFATVNLSDLSLSIFIFLSNSLEVMSLSRFLVACLGHVVPMFAAVVDLNLEFCLSDFGFGGLPLFLSTCLLYTSPSPRDATLSRMPSSA